MTKLKDIIESKTGCVIIMAGSESDKPHIDKIVNSLNKYGIPNETRIETRICSAHKQPAKLMEIIEGYNKIDGLVAYVAVAGGTDALSGTLSFHTYGPVISCPPDTKYSGVEEGKPKPIKELNETCLQNPPGSSNAYISRAENVGKFIAQMFAGVNPGCRKILEEEKTKKIKSLEEADKEYQI